jgi:hypothetical protein
MAVSFHSHAAQAGKCPRPSNVEITQDALAKPPSEHTDRAGDPNGGILARQGSQGEQADRMPLPPMLNMAIFLFARCFGLTSGKALRFAHLGFGRVVRNMRIWSSSRPKEAGFFSSLPEHVEKTPLMPRPTKFNR